MYYLYTLIRRCCLEWLTISCARSFLECIPVKIEATSFTGNSLAFRASTLGESCSNPATCSREDGAFGTDFVRNTAMPGMSVLASRPRVFNTQGGALRVQGRYSSCNASRPTPDYVPTALRKSGPSRLDATIVEPDSNTAAVSGPSADNTTCVQVSSGKIFA
jgi:hypothetical protein